MNPIGFHDEGLEDADRKLHQAERILKQDSEILKSGNRAIKHCADMLKELESLIEDIIHNKEEIVKNKQKNTPASIRLSKRLEREQENLIHHFRTRARELNHTIDIFIDAITMKLPDITSVRTMLEDMSHHFEKLVRKEKQPIGFR